MDLGLKEKRAFVAASTRGLGFATAMTLAREDEAASLRSDASSSESLDESANPDAVSQGHLSGPENGSGRSGRDLERQVNESFSMPIHIPLS